MDPVDGIEYFRGKFMPSGHTDQKKKKKGGKITSLLF